MAVFGLGAVGLAVVQGAQMRGAARIFAVDTNPGKFELAAQLGATDCVNPADHDAPIQEVLVGMTQWGVDYTFDATGQARSPARRPCSPPRHPHRGGASSGS